MFKNILSLTFKNVAENELNESFDKLKRVKKDIKKAEDLQGPNKIKQITLKDFKDSSKIAKHKKESDKNVVKLKKMII